MHIKYYVPAFGKEEKRAASKVIDSGFLASGKCVEELENRYSELCGGDYCIAVNSATSGLYLVLSYFEKLKKWKVPAYTFCATYQSAIFANKEVTIEDVDNNYRMVDDNKAYSLKVIFAGKHILNDEYCWNIIDAAHCFPYKSDLTRVHSFYPTKPIASNGGGMIVTQDKALACYCKMMRQHGRREAVGHAENPLSGFNFWLSDLNATITIEQLKKIDYLRESRNAIAERYVNGLKGIDCYFGDHLMILRFENKIKREYVQTSFMDAEIEYSRPYIPLANRNKCPNAWNLYERSISIPYYPGLKKREQDFIIKTVLEVI